MLTRAAVAAVAILGPGRVPAQEPLAPRPAQQQLVQASLELARTGRADEWRELSALLLAVGLPQKEVDAHRMAGERELGKARKGASIVRASKLLCAATTTLARSLASLPDGPRQRLAELLLRLDGELAEAHQVMGHELFAATWGQPGEARRHERRRVIATAFAAAKKLELPIVLGPSDDAMLTAALGKPGACAKACGLELHSAFVAQQTERILRQTLRAAAFVNFLDTGVLAVPDYGRQKSVLFRSRAHYLQAVRQLLDQRRIDAESGALAMRDGMNSFRFMNQDPQLQLCAVQTEGDAEVMWLTTLEYWRGKYPCLTAGCVNLVCRELLGQPMPRMAEIVTKDRAAGGGTRAVDQLAVAERERWLALAPAGMHGSRLWMRYLVTRGEEPKWTSTMHEQLATLQGDELLKATLMVDFLSEQGLYVGLAGRAAASQEVDQRAALAAGVGASLPDLEERWRHWLLGRSIGLVQRLQQTETTLPPMTAAVLAAVQRLRTLAGLPECIEHDAELGLGCGNHARYLLRHREQVQRWPDAHEEYPDREGWSAAGSMAGHASVIAPGTKADEQAVTAWMATFFHRLPLLQPGLRRIGYAREGDIAVMDCGTMVDPRNEVLDTVVVWPFDGMTGTPTHFAPELPNPVPAQDQSQFGYPITVQCGHRSSHVPVALHMVLREQDEHGVEVACWVASPQAPGNPELVPENAFCLIPKAPLRAGVTYFVAAEFLGEGAKKRWTFKT